MLDKNKQGTGIRRQQRRGGMFVVGRVCVTLTRILVETTDWACLRSYGVYIRMVFGSCGEGKRSRRGEEKEGRMKV